MIGRRAVAVLLAAALLPAGCGLLGALPAPPEPVASASPASSPVATDAPVPYTLRAAVEPARRFLVARRAEIGGGPIGLRFVEGRCTIGAVGALIFEQQPAGGSTDSSAAPAYAIAFADDIAAGIIADAWWVVYDVPDPATQPDLVRVLEGREIPCP